MKQLFLFLLLISTTLYAHQAHGPYRSADMEQTDASGYVLQTFVAVEHKLSEFKRKDRTVSFEFSETSLGKTKFTSFHNIRKSLADCGSTQYVGYSVRSKMVLMDHSTRLCDDVQPHQWVLKIYSTNNSIRYFRGNPKMAGDFDCERFASQPCVMLYAPATCYYQKTSAEGSNSCFAIAELKKKLCEQGYDADKIRDEEIACTMQNICPLPMCVAPAEGCTYEPSNELNEYGCPLHPCGILKCGQ